MYIFYEVLKRTVETSPRYVEEDENPCSPGRWEPLPSQTLDLVYTLLVTLPLRRRRSVGPLTLTRFCPVAPSPRPYLSFRGRGIDRPIVGTISSYFRKTFPVSRSPLFTGALGAFLRETWGVRRGGVVDPNEGLFETVSSEPYGNELSTSQLGATDRSLSIIIMVKTQRRS